MGQTVAQFHETGSELLISAWHQHKGRAELIPVDRENAVTVWRHTAHLFSDYANGHGENWSAFWDAGMNREKFRSLLDRRSRFNRCGTDGDAKLYADSILSWEFDLTREVITSQNFAQSAHSVGYEEPARRLGHDHEVGVSVVTAYTGCSLPDVRRALTAGAGGLPERKYQGAKITYTPNPLFDLIRANRPTL